ncbi:MAG: hypothetical protein ACE5Q5_05180 [Nitrosarchaeum sp.]
MSTKCKVCNTSRIKNVNPLMSDEKWECQICGNLLDVHGNVNSS